MSSSPESCTILYKILTEAEFDALYNTPPIKGDLWIGTSLDKNDGFIHTSTSTQVGEFLHKLFVKPIPALC
jgi:uncharacterized protein (DUF952 family)